MDMENHDEELDNFLSNVDSITKILEGLVSDDQKDQERAIRQADILLHDGSGDKEFAKGASGGTEAEPQITADRTVINKYKDSENEQGDMSTAAFMRMAEKDAEERAKDLEIRKKKSDEFRAKANRAFRKQNYAKALDNYNKAIQEIRDSPCLYTNRALTYIRIGIASKAIEDLDRAIDLNSKSLKARLLKARALLNICQPESCKEWLAEIKEEFPGNLPMIERYEDDLFELRMELNVAYDGKRKNKNSKDTPEVKQHPPTPDDLKSRLHNLADPETLWIKAARGELGHCEEDSD